jgi:hypothetical protein
MQENIEFKLDQQIKFVQKLEILPLKIEKGEYDFQSVVVKSEKTMYVYFCGALQHKIFNLPTFNVDIMSDLFLKVCLLTERYYNITANFKFVINEFNSIVEGSI